VRSTISLNWRLIQVPETVRDYIILHEFTHLRHLNHSARFWAAVEQVCPAYRAAENWLKHNSARAGILKPRQPAPKPRVKAVRNET
jgi:hypothetical protein